MGTGRCTYTYTYAYTWNSHVGHVTTLSFVLTFESLSSNDIPSLAQCNRFVSLRATTSIPSFPFHFLSFIFISSLPLFFFFHSFLFPDLFLFIPIISDSFTLRLWRFEVYLLIRIFRPPCGRIVKFGPHRPLLLMALLMKLGVAKLTPRFSNAQPKLKTI